MKRVPLLLIVALNICFFVHAGLKTDIHYTTENISGDIWVYHYTVSNIDLVEGIEEFTIWFEYGKYTSVQINSDISLDAAWDQLVWQPNESLKNNGGFDALSIVDPIAVGESVAGFSVSFIWNGPDEPGRQFYEIINPDNPSEVLDSGFTVLVPEPISLVLMLIGSCVRFFSGAT